MAGVPIPIIVPVGMVLVYSQLIGLNQAGTVDVIPTNTDRRFGIVSQVWVGGEVFIYGGDSVMLNENDVINKLQYGNGLYHVIPARLVTIETPLP